mmetsp:Transcript_39141/g.81887  ORF Transcript_39141/g.81887 Transcript_39141/m.81887 type:complete len:305 (+) Transcript_39141:213-1127(+)
MVLESSLESNALNSAMFFEDNAPKTIFMRSSKVFNMGKRKVSRVAKSLAKRIKISTENRLSTAFDPLLSSSYTPGPGPDISYSLSFSSDAETVVRNNLTSRYARSEVSLVNCDLAQPEVWNSESGTDLRATNIVCQVYDSIEPRKKAWAQPKLLVATAQCDGDVVELLHPTDAAMPKEVTISAEISPPESLLPLHSSVVHVSSRSKGSNSSHSSQGILLIPKRAIGGYDPFGNSDLSSHQAARPQRRVQFSNMDILKGNSALDSIMEAQASGILPSDWSDDSSTSFEYLMNWCGGVPSEDTEEM